MKDEEILDLFIDRNEQAIKEVNSKYGQLCKTIADNILCSKEDAEECLNDTLDILWNNIPPEYPISLCAYICRICRNVSMQKKRYRMSEKRKYEYSDSSDEILDSVIAKEDVELEYEAIELKKTVEDFVSELDLTNRRIFIMRYWFCFDNKKIADILSINKAVVNQRLLRLRKKLRGYLEERGYQV